MLILGLFPRAAALVAFLCEQSFLHRNPIFAYGVDLIASVFLLYLCFADYRADSAERRDYRSALGSMAYRLCQLQICIIYAFSGLDKVRGATWWKGEALWYVSLNPQYSNFDMSWIAHFPFLLAAMTYGSMIWEVYFPALIWVKPIRYPVLVGGVLLHIGIAAFMGLQTFGIMMIVLYTLFLRRADAEKIAHCVKKVIKPRKVLVGSADESYV
jgi:hypothetical protein